jgi:uncharacterized protein (TIGR00290 family)
LTAHPDAVLAVKVALSWSGGKDSALALAGLRAEGHVVTLVHLTDADSRRDRAHGVPDFLIQEQAAALGLPLHLGASDVRGYEAVFLDALREVAPDAVAFGDIDFVPHREWGEALARKAGVRALWPLWGMPTRAVAEEAVKTMRAFVVACRPPLDATFLGRFLDEELLRDVEARGADPAGERGEYHTFVVEGPGFRRRVEATAGDVAPLGDGWRLDVGLRGC